MANLITSIRLTPELTRKLTRAARVLHQGKNSIIKEALEAYFQKLEHGKLEAEARRQSILASKSKTNNDWDEQADTEEWI